MIGAVLERMREGFRWDARLQDHRIQSEREMEAGRGVWIGKSQSIAATTRNGCWTNASTNCPRPSSWSGFNYKRNVGLEARE